MRALVLATDGFELVGSASCGEEAVEQTERLRPALVLMDVRMPGIGGVEAARQIAARLLPVIVVLVTAGDLPSDVPPGTAAAIIPKRDLSGKFLSRLRDDIKQTTAGPPPYLASSSSSSER